MYSNTHFASAVAAAALFVLSTENALAQSEGDCFSSRGVEPISWRYPRFLKEPDLIVEWEKKPVPEDPFDPELLVRDRELIPDPFPILKGDEKFTEEDDAFVEATKRKVLYPVVRAPGLVGAAPILQGWTNGTISCKKGLKGKRRYGILIPPSKIKRRAKAVIDDYSEAPFSSSESLENTFSPGDSFTSGGYNTGWQIVIPPPEPLPKIDYSRVQPLRKTIHDIWAIESSYMECAAAPTAAQKARLAMLYMRAAGQEDNQVMKAYYRCRSHLMAKNMIKAFAEIDLIYKLVPDNDTIFEDLASEFRYEDLVFEAKIIGLYSKGLGSSPKIRMLTMRGLKALDRHDWISAWQNFEQVYLLNPHPELAREIAFSYNDRARDMETCIWCSRCLPIADDWETFEKMWELRATIEGRHYEEFLKKEPKITAHWPANKIPLKVYFPPEAEADCDFYILMDNCLTNWMYVARGKLDWVKVNDESKADLIISRPPEIDNRYKDFKGGNAPPTGIPRPPALGSTFPEYAGLTMKKARIEMYDSMQAMPEQRRKDIYLHEIGHALGMIEHSKETKDIMYPYGRQSREFLILDNDLSFGDVQRLKAAYKDVPLNKAAFEKYTGMKALCQRLADNPQIVSNSQLPDHLANLMPVHESIGIVTRNTLGDDGDWLGSDSAEYSSDFPTHPLAAPREFSYYD